MLVRNQVRAKLGEQNILLILIITPWHPSPLPPTAPRHVRVALPCRIGAENRDLVGVYFDLRPQGKLDAVRRAGHRRRCDGFQLPRQGEEEGR